MRQLVAFLDRIHVRNSTEKYYQMKFDASLNGAELTASLDDFLGVASEESAFDEETDKALEQQALVLLEERKRAASVRRSLNKN